MVEIKDLLPTIVSKLPSPNSRLAYIRDIRQYQAWCVEQNINKPLELGQEEAQLFIDHLRSKFSVSTIARKVSAIRSVFKEALHQKIISYNPFENFVQKAPKKQKPKMRALDASEIERVLLFPKLHTEEGYRDYVMMYLMFSLGMKIGEVTSVNYKDFRSYQDGMLLHIRKPGTNGYYSKISKSTQKVLNEYIKKYRITGFMFTSMAKNRNKNMANKEPLTARSGWVIIKKYLKLAKLDRGRTTNCAREFFVQYLLEEGVSADTLRRVLGLGSLNAMRRYGITDLEKAKSLLTFKDHPVDKIQLNIREY